MDIRRVAFYFCIFNCYSLACYAYRCGSVQNITYAKIPGTTSLLPLSDFEKFIVNYQMSRVYVVVPPWSLVVNTAGPHTNLISSITKVKGTENYMQSTFGETSTVNPQCCNSNTRLTLQYLSKKAIFNLEGKDAVIAFWSSCPTRYVWSMKCSKHNIGHKTCLLQDVMLSLYTHETMNDIPLNDIVEDLCGATEVKFGVQNFKWVFTYGQTSNCRTSQQQNQWEDCF